MVPGMDSWDSIIVALGDTAVVAEARRWPASMVSGWKSRGIPSTRWSSIVELAAERNVSGVTLELLARLAARKLEEARA